MPVTVSESAGVGSTTGTVGSLVAETLWPVSSVNLAVTLSSWPSSGSVARKLAFVAPLMATQLDPISSYHW
jgi:hypothetical protein